MKSDDPMPAARPPLVSEGTPPRILAARATRVGGLRETLAACLEGGGAVTLEFGCGHGHWLTGYAEAHPTRRCIGVDLISARIRKARAKRDRRGLRGLHFLKAEATELLEAWPTASPIDEVFMLFPDPWPKKRHFKHRMIQPALLSAVAALCRPGARFHFRTDDKSYFEWTEEHFAAHSDWTIEKSADWPWEHATIFQAMMDSWESLIARRR
ncbi:MAG: tRNA (guanosine(46)-N7)-methyltransferase TrmB [Verrucomicrobiota bacterium]